MANKDKIKEIYANIIAITDAVCNQHLNKDYAELARKLATTLSRKRPSPLQTGACKSWACAIVYALGKVNFLFDKEQTPHLSSKELAALFEVSPQTASSKANTILEMMKIMPLDPRWCISKNLAHNPLLQMAEMMEMMEMMDRNKEARSDKELIEKMIKSLPIPVSPIQELAILMRDNGYKLAPNQKLMIKSVFYMGEEGGIVCDITPEGETKEVLVVSITHLNVYPSHPLAKEIINYQKKRIKSLQR